MSVDWLPLHAKIDLDATPEALYAALRDPEQSWWARRRLTALAATGALTAAYNPLLHPKGKDGRWIERFGWVRWLDKDMKWRSGWVEDIDPSTGGLTVRNGNQHFQFGDAKKLYARPRPKAKLNLPNVIDKTTPDGWTKTGGQGGSNPGAMFEITAPPAGSDWPEITSRSGAGHVLNQIADTTDIDAISDVVENTVAPVPDDHTVAVVPSIDHLPGRYDFVVKDGGKWYRVPAVGPMRDAAGDMNPDLEVPVADVFGDALTTRRIEVANNANTWTAKPKAEIGPNEIALYVQGIATQKPRVGDKFYVKTMNIPERANNEALANDLYEALGVPIPDVNVGKDGLTLSSKLIGEKVKLDKNNPAHLKTAQDAFIADAWLANWDAIGQPVGDNMQVDPDGRVWRVDAGGALLYRAMGLPKGGMFGETVGEIDSLRNPSMNPSGAVVYGSISKEQMQQQALLLRSISNQRIRDLVEANHLPDSLADTLIARRLSILDQLDVPDTNPNNHGAMPQPDVSPTVTVSPTHIGPGAKVGELPYETAVQLEQLMPGINEGNPLYPGMSPAEIHQKLTQPKSLGGKVVSHVEQMGTGPKIHVDNYGISLAAVPTATFAGFPEDDNETVLAILDETVWKLAGDDLWVYDSDYVDHGQKTWSFTARNLFTGEKDHVTVISGYSDYVEGYVRDSPETEQLVDLLKIQRDLAQNDIVADSLASSKTLDEIMVNPGEFADVEPFRHYQFAVPFTSVQQAIDAGRLGTPEDQWVIRQGGDATGGPGSEGAVWEVVNTSDLDVRLRIVGAPVDEAYDTVISKQQWAASGPWYRPGNDTTSKIWKARGQKDWDDAHGMDSGQVSTWDEKQKLAAWNQPAGSSHDFPDDSYPTPTEIATDEELFQKHQAAEQAIADAKALGPEIGEYSAQEIEDAELEKTSFSGGYYDPDHDVWVEGGVPPPGWEDPAAVNPDKEQLHVEDEQTSDLATAQPTQSKALVAGVVAGLAPTGETYLSTELDLDDIELLKNSLLNQTVVVLPQGIAEDPESSAFPITNANGMGVVTAISVEKEWIGGYWGDYVNGEHTFVQSKGYQDVVKIWVSFGNGYSTTVTGVDVNPKKYPPKSIIPVGVDPIPAPATFKQNGEVVLNGTTIGSWHKDYEYYVTINADYSINGHPIQFSMYKQGAARQSVARFAVPIAPPVKVSKPAKVYLTEEQLKDLNSKLAVAEMDIGIIESQLAEAAKAPLPPVGGGVPLNDGHIPAKGDWVFSTKDGTYAQIVSTGTGKDPPDTVRVKIIKPDGTVLSSTRRKRADLVAAAGPGEKPWVLSTKATQTSALSWFGPGSIVHMSTGGKVTVLDTQTDGTVKILKPDGTKSWTTTVYIAGVHEHTTVKHPAGSYDVDALNAQLAGLQDVQKNLALEIAKGTKPPPKPKKPFGTPYPGPGGLTVKQPASLAQVREDKGLKNFKDGFAPQVGQILRHNDGTQYVVTEVGSPPSSYGYGGSHKNSVKVVPKGMGWPEKWKANSTLVVDHEAMLTNQATGAPLPVITSIPGAHDDLPLSQLRWLFRRKESSGYYDTNHKYRSVEYDIWLAQDHYGQVWNLGTGTKASAWYVGGAERVAYIDMTTEGYGGPDPKVLTVSVGEKKSVGTVFYTAIHAPETDPATLFGGNKPVPVSEVPEVVPPVWAPGAETALPTPETAAEIDELLNPEAQQAIAEGKVYNPTTGLYETPKIPPEAVTPTGDLYVYNNVTDKHEYVDQYKVITAPVGHYTIVPGSQQPTQAEPGAPPTPTPPPAPAPAAPVTPVTPLPTPKTTIPLGELPLYGGDENALTTHQVPHPPTLKAGQSKPVFKVSGSTTIDRQALPGTHSVMGAIADTVTETQANKGKTFIDAVWTAKYALADHDVIEDNLVHTQVVRDANGIEYVDVQFQLSRAAAKHAHNTFFTSTNGEIGDWDYDRKKPTGLTVNDKINVRVSHFETYEGKLKPSKSEAAPNATITSEGVLIGKNPSGQFDVYRFEVVTATGDIGYIDLEDRNEPSVWVAAWNETKAVKTNGAKSLNALAKDDGWSLRHNELAYDMQPQGGHHQLSGDGAKMAGSPSHPKGAGSGFVIQRDYQGAEITYATTGERNALDGTTRIRVRADDPEAQRKISEMMQLVGVSTEAQQPPDKAALTKMALNKIWTQYRDHYNVEEVSNATIDDPSQAFDAVDKALGLTGADKMSMADISLRIHPDGRVTVLLSERIADIIAKQNKTRYYSHRYYDTETKEAVLGMVQGRTPGLLASNERYQQGLFYPGMSPKSDHPTNGARYTFTRAKRDSGNYVNGGHPFGVFHPYAMHRQVDFYWNKDDDFGRRDPYANTNFMLMNGMADNNELLIRRGIGTEIFGRVVLSASTRDSYIAELKKRGITHAPNGMLLEDFFIVKFTPGMLEKPNFGTEIPLDSIPVAPPAPAAPVAVA